MFWITQIHFELEVELMSLARILMCFSCSIMEKMSVTQQVDHPKESTIQLESKNPVDTLNKVRLCHFSRLRCHEKNVLIGKLMHLTSEHFLLY